MVQSWAVAMGPKYPKGYNVKESREPFEFHIHWIDTEEKNEF